MRIIKITALWLVVFGTGSLALAEEHRHHGPHVHGNGQLNVAVEKSTLAIDLSMPAMNIVGFEHPPQNSEERTQVQHAAEVLKDGLRVFGPSSAAKCTLTAADVKSALLGNSDDHEDAEQGDGEEHADFDISYEFNCKDPSQLTSLHLTLFELFPGTKQLHTQVITPDGQSAADLNSEQTTLKLK
jgi:Protein of unknown function (DUF2796)